MLQLPSIQTLHDYHVRILRGHGWAWRGDFDPEMLKGLVPGQPVRLCSREGELVGTGFVNPLSHIAFRIFSRDESPPSAHAIRARIDAALTWRMQIRQGKTVYRLVYGESDGLPGLIVDRYDRCLVISQTVAGMEAWSEVIIDHLIARLDPEIVILKNSNRLRELEGLPLETRVVHGTWNGWQWVTLDGLQIPVDCLHGRKTGLFLDQQDNRQLLGKIMLEGGARVLDLFCHAGLWGLTALQHGAKGVVAVDMDERALLQCQEAATRNGFGNQLITHSLDCREFLQSNDQSYEVVVLDPPAFAKKKRFLKNALELYQEMNFLAMEKVCPGGLLVTSSCSSFVSETALELLLVETARRLGRALRLVAIGRESMDHPVLPAMPETHYLKCLFCQIL